MNLSAIATTFKPILLSATIGVLPAAEIANSLSEFDPNGTQGVNGWTYGFRDYTADGGGNDYGVNDSIAFSVAGGWTWTGIRWDWAAGDPPYTTIDTFGAHPGAGASEQWAIRRYQVEITEPTPLAVTWSISDGNVGCGSGVTGSIHLNGALVHSHAIVNGDTVGATHTVYVNASPGDFIDLALSPEGPAGQRDDACDGTFISMVVNTDIPSNPLQPDGTPFIPAAPFTLSPNFTWTHTLLNTSWQSSENWNSGSSGIPGINDTLLLAPSSLNRLSLNGTRSVQAARITSEAFLIFNGGDGDASLTLAAGQLIVDGASTSWCESPLILGAQGQWHISNPTGKFRVDGWFEGSNGLSKTGLGTLQLNTPSVYTGETVVKAGRLEATNSSGSATGPGPVRVGFGGTLAGSGSISGNITVEDGGTIAPGLSIGTLNAAGDVILNGTYQCELNATGSDRLVVTGNLDLTNATLDFVETQALTPGTRHLATYGTLTGGQFATVQNLPADYAIIYNFDAGSGPNSIIAHNINLPLNDGGNTPTHYVSLSGGNVFPYDTPAKAATDIQSAVNVAMAGDVVIVADGTYASGSTTVSGENLANRVLIDRAVTVRSENGAATTTITGAYGTGADAPLGPDAIRGVRLSGEATLEGFSITGGATIHFLPTPVQDGKGGGVYISGSASLIDCIVSNCRSSREGAGIANDGTAGAVIQGTRIENNATTFSLFGGSSGAGFHLGNATVQNCHVEGNSHASIGSTGGGGYLSGTSTLTGTTFTSNTATNGGGLYLLGNSGMSGNTFSNNIATGDGGGAYLTGSGNPIAPVLVENCDFFANTATNGLGGGIYALNVEPSLSYCELQANEANRGGAIFFGEPGHLDHCLVTGNVAGDYAGGAFIRWGTITNSTITGNRAGNEGGALAASSSISTLTCLNTIIFANEANGSTTTRSASIHQLGNGFLGFQNCLVENSTGSNTWAFGSNYLDQGHNIDADPKFLSAITPSSSPTTIGDFHIDPATSPALDAGNSISLSPTATDLDGETRIRGAEVDLGVYEDNVTSFWTGTAGADWATSSNWQPGVPGPFAELQFQNDASSFQVDLDGPRTAEIIRIQSGQNYTFNNSTLTIGRFLGITGNATQQFNSAITLQQDNEWDIVSGAILNAQGPINDSGAGRSLTKSGSGRLELSGANTFSGGLVINDGSVALRSDLAAGTGPITATLAPDDLLVADFTNGPEFPTFSSDGFFIDYSSGDAHFNGTNDLGRSILRTAKSDLYQTDFVSEVTVTVVSGATAYLGFGEGSRVAPTYEPLGQPHVFARLSTGDLIISDNGTDIDPPSSGEVGAGTHRLRLTFDRAASELTFEIHQNYSGGPFIPTTTLAPIDCSDNGFTNTNSRIFFGGNLGVRFDDFAVQSSNDITVNIEYGDNVTIANPVILHRETTTGIGGPDAVFPIAVSDGQTVTQAGAISETGGPFTLEFHGGGNLILGGQNSFSGGTIVKDGQLTVTGTTGSGPLDFRGGGTLRGTGIITGPVQTDSRIGIQPGISSVSTGTLTFESSLSAEPVVYVCQIDGASNDQIVVNGNLDLSGVQLIVGRTGSGLNQPAYIIASYQSLTAEFASVLSLPSGYTIDYAFNDGTSSNNIALVSRSITPFEEWVVLSGLSFGINADMSDDPNNDGIPNIIHFATDTDPLGSGSNEGKRRLSTTTFPNGEHLTLTIPVRVGATFAGNPSPEATVDGITYQIQGTSDLVNWADSVIEITPAQSAGLPPLRDLDGDTFPDWEYRTFAIEIDGSSQRFFRIGFEESPAP